LRKTSEDIALLEKLEKIDVVNFNVLVNPSALTIDALHKNVFISKGAITIFMNSQSKLVVILSGPLSEEWKLIIEGRKEFEIIDYTEREKPKKLNKKLQENLSEYLRINGYTASNKDVLWRLTEYLDSIRVISYYEAMIDYLKLAIPYTVIGICTSCGFYSLGIVFRFGGKHGQEELASLPIIFGFMSLVLFPAGFLMKAPGAEFAKLRGAIIKAEHKGTSTKELKKSTALLFQQSILISELLSIPVIVTFIFSKQILLFLGQPNNVSEIVKQFFHVLMFGVPLLLGINPIVELLVAYQKPVPIILQSALYLIFSTLISWPFILGLWGLPRYGIAAFGVGNLVMLAARSIGLILYLLVKKEFRDLGLFKLQCNLNEIKRRVLSSCGIIWHGVPIAIQYYLEDMGLVVATALTGLLGERNLVAVQTADQYCMPLIFLLNSLAQVNTVNVARERGKCNFKSASRHALTGFLITTFVLVGINILFWTISKYLSYPFVDIHAEGNQGLLPTIRNLFRLQGTNLIIRAGKDMYMGSLRGYNYNAGPVIFSIIGNIVFIGLAIILGFPAKLGVEGIFSGRLISAFLTTIPMYLLWIVVNKKAVRTGGLSNDGKNKSQSCVQSIKNYFLGQSTLFYKNKESQEIENDQTRDGTDSIDESTGLIATPGGVSNIN